MHVIRTAVPDVLILEPKVFVHGFLVLSESVDFLHKTTNYYHPGSEQSLLWCDSAIGIEWPLAGMTPQLAPKDSVGILLQHTRVFG